MGIVHIISPLHGEHHMAGFVAIVCEPVATILRVIAVQVWGALAELWRKAAPNMKHSLWALFALVEQKVWASKESDDMPGRIAQPSYAEAFWELLQNFIVLWP